MKYQRCIRYCFVKGFLSFFLMLVGEERIHAITLNNITIGSPLKERLHPAWNGFYFGANAGWGWSRFASSETPFGIAALADIVPQRVQVNTTGPLFGGQVGYNFTYRAILIGAEVDLDGTGIQSTAVTSSPSIASLSDVSYGLSTNGFTVNENTGVLGSVRGRLGANVNPLSFLSPWLIYFTAGAAWRQNDIVVTGNGNVVSIKAWSQLASQRYNTVQSGYVLGGGSEWPVAVHWTIRAEYLFYGFAGSNAKNIYFSNSTPTGSGITVSTNNTSLNVFRLGVNYLI